MINYIWLRDETKIDELVDLFLKNTTEEYITHIEIQEGRADEDGTWSANLRDTLKFQFYVAIKKNNILVAIDIDKDTILGFISVLYNEDNIITIEDIVSTQKGIGTELLSVIEEKARRYDYKTIVGDVGPNNERAKRFMEANGYTAKTIVYTKNI